MVGIPHKPSSLARWQTCWKFAVHTLSGSFSFAAIGASAALIDLAVQRLQHLNVSLIVIYGLAGLEYMLFASDFICFAVFLMRTTLRAIQSV